MKFFDKLPRVIGWSFFLLWILWNTHWFRQGELAPSALLYFANIPAPSTGMTRSVMAMADGRFSEGFLWNPFTLPLCAVFILSMLHLLKSLLTKQTLILPSWLAWSWLVVLVLAEVTKLAMGPAWW